MSNGMNNHNKKLNKALQLLNEAASETKDEFTHGFERIRANAVESIEDAGETLKDAASDISKKVRKNPWKFIGGAVAAGLVVGYVAGLFKNRK